MSEKRYALTYEDEDSGKNIAWLTQHIMNDPELPSLTRIVIGPWGECYEESCQPLIDMFCENADRFAHIESIFIGDMDYEDCECSWIQQGDYEAIFKALPNLKGLTVKGSDGLELGKMNHENLRHFESISGGLPSSVVKSLIKSNLPNLETLILYIGVENYGWEGEIDDLKALTDAERFPKLTHLGLCNSEEQDAVTALVLESDILPQLKVLELSCGTLTDKGGQLLLDAADRLLHLERLILTYHYLSDEMMEKLKTLPFEVELSEQQEYDDEYSCPMITE